MFLKYVCCDISEENVLILFIFGTMINHDRILIHVKYTLALCQNVAVMSIVSYMYVCSDISELNLWILFILATVINHHRSLMHKKIYFDSGPKQSTCAQCVITAVYLCDSSHVNSGVVFIFCIVTIYHKSLKHVKSNFTPSQNRAN